MRIRIDDRKNGQAILGFPTVHVKHITGDEIMPTTQVVSFGLRIEITLIDFDGWINDDIIRGRIR